LFDLSDTERMHRSSSVQYHGRREGHDFSYARIYNFQIFLFSSTALNGETRIISIGHDWRHRLDFRHSFIDCLDFCAHAGGGGR